MKTPAALMREAAEAALSVRGTTLPNPAVGAILWNNAGQEIARGATALPGGDHAEASALRCAGERARGAVMAVTLEPCVDFPGKRTPSCAKRIIAAGVKRVLIGCQDPDPRVHGRGIALLRKAGIEVQEESLNGRIPDFYAGFARFRATGLPRVTVKIALSADGMATAVAGRPTAITGPASRRFVHRLRAESDAILIGKGTLLADDPELTVREATGNSPHRYVLWSGDLPERDFRLLHGGPTTFAGSGERPKHLPDNIGWLELPGSRQEAFSALVAALGKLGVHDLLVEPGPGLLHLIDRNWQRLFVLRSKRELPGGVPFSFSPVGAPTELFPLGEDSAERYDQP